MRSEPSGLAHVLAENSGPFTLDGTRTYLVGRDQVAVIDPGPDLPAHVQAVVRAVAGARSVTVLVTHGHGDHAGAAAPLAEAVGAPVLGPTELGAADRTLGEGDVVHTDRGPLIAVDTPGHTRFRPMRSEPSGLAHVLAENSGPFTLDGTRTYLVGRDQVAVIDPGPDLPAHVQAVVRAVAGARSVTVLVTHGHGDHAGAAAPLAEAVGAPVLGPTELGAADRTLGEGDVVHTDRGPLIAVDTPGHTRGHLSYHWPHREALFVGDLLLGRGDTTWVAEYSGCVADYLDSLARLRRMAPRVLYPGHGPPITDPGRALDRFETHRRARVRQVEEALARNPSVEPDELMGLVYGDTVPPALQAAARRSIDALVEHLAARGRTAAGRAQGSLEVQRRNDDES